MRLVQSGNRWVLYGDDGKIIIITSHKGVAERLMQDGTGKGRRKRKKGKT